MKKMILFVTISIMVVASAYFVLSNVLTKQSDDNDKINIAVSILPQTYFVKAIGKEMVSVFEIVPPGAEPATYEPLPMQISKLSHASIYFTIGVPFENRFLSKIQKELKETRFVKTDNVDRIEIAHHHHENEIESGEKHRHEHGEKDPHIWLDPQLVKKEGKIIYETLSAVDPENQVSYKKNFDNFNKEMDDLDIYIKNRLSNVKGASFIVFHPVWGYFAKRYGINQVAIEVEGKEPSPADIQKIIERAKEKNVRAIFLQKQFNRKSGEKIGKAIGLKPFFLDPLSGDYINNMKHIADVMSKELKQGKQL